MLFIISGTLAGEALFMDFRRECLQMLMTLRARGSTLRATRLGNEFFRNALGAR